MFSFFAGVLATLAAFFVVNSLGFWLLVAAAVIYITWAVQMEKGARATFCFLATVVVLGLSNGLTPLGLMHWAYDHPLLFGGGIIGYFLFGAAWSMAKLKLYAKDLRKKYNSMKKAFQRKNQQDVDEKAPIKLELKAAWAEFITDQQRPGYVDGKEDFRGAPFVVLKDGSFCPEPEDLKSTLLMWSTYWPVSLTWFMLRDPIRRLFHMLYERLYGIYRSILQTEFAGTENDILTTKDREELEAQKDRNMAARNVVQEPPYRR